MIAQKTVSRDPLRALPTDVSQRIFSQLSIRDLSRCSRVSKKWNKSQTLNYGEHYSAAGEGAGLLTQGLHSVVPTLSEGELP